MFSAKKRLDAAFQNAKVIPFDDADSFILFSDCHRGNNSYSDDFSHNREIYFHALTHYNDNNFSYVELGDGDELWENRSFKSIFNAHKNIYLVLKKFHDKQKLHLIWGNHDMDYKDAKAVKKNLESYFDTDTETTKPLFNDLKYDEAIVLKHKKTSQKLFLIHGHQADLWNYKFWKFSRFLVRYLWNSLQRIGIKDPTSPAKNFKELLNVEKKIEDWMRLNDNQMTIVGHTHRPQFSEPNELPFFNDGSCVHPHSITGIEITNGQIALIKWIKTTTKEGLVKIQKEYMKGPQELIEYLKK